MRRALTLACCGALFTGCGGEDSSERARDVCEDVYAHTDSCLADIGCEGAVDRGLYVDQCLTSGLTPADRDAFVVSACDAVNAGACLADASFYRDSCACAVYSDCPPETFCTQLDADTLCLDAQQHIPSSAPLCNVTNPCPPGWVCGVPSASATSGACIQRCH